jgi:hypothetical protein
MRSALTGRSKKQVRLKSAGAISLALCLVMPLALLMFASIYLESNRVRARLDLTRGTVSIAESALALYDRELYGDFGLFALDSQDMDRALSSLIGPDQEVVYRLEALDSLSDTQVLKASISRHMTWRAASSLIKDTLDKFDKIRSLGQELSVSSLTDLIPADSQADLQAVDPDLGYDQGQEPEWYEDYSAYMDDEVRSVYQEALTNLAPAIMPSASGDMENLDFDPFTGSGLDSLASLVDQILVSPEEGILDRLTLCEYSLSYFSSKAPFVIRDGLRYEDKTPDGRIISQFPQARSLEVEEIATGLAGLAGQSLVFMFITSIRFALHLLHVLMDPDLMADYRMKATIVVAAIATLSLGEVVIPPEIMTWVLVVGDSLRLSVSDTIKLQNGNEVDLWPGLSPVNVAMRYKDYLRLLLILQSPDTLTDRISVILSRVHPGTYCTSLACHADWQDVSLSHAAAFISRLPLEDQ